MWAANKGNADVAKLLLDHGAAVDDTADGVTPLLVAAAMGHTDTVALFLERGADIRAVNPYNGTALILAADKGWTDTARLLLDRGADINAKNNRGESALSFAAARGNVELVRLLLNKGADPRVRSTDGKTPSLLAQEANQGELARLLRQAEQGKMDARQPSVERQPTPAMPLAMIPASDVDRVPSARTAMKKHAYAVVIGIEQYREKLPKADFADRDARLVGEYLTKVLGYPEENVVVRVNDRATRTDLVKYFEEWLRNNVEPGSSVFIYYSGHGAPNAKNGEAYLVPYDGDPSFVDSTAYPVKQLYAALDKLPAKDITVVLDSCFSGSGGRSVLAKGARPMVISVENPVLASGKTVVLAASKGDQISNSFEEQGHGLLTYYFLKGLQGEGDVNKDGVIEMAELYDYIRPNVQRIARKQYNNEQTPQLLANPEALRKGNSRLVDRKNP